MRDIKKNIFIKFFGAEEII